MAVLAVLLLALGALSGCARGGRVVKIGVIAPSSGPLSALGIGITNAARLAVEQANERDELRGWTIELVAHDDASDPAEGVAAARELIADDDVAAVIGTYNSGVAKEVAPILERAGIAMISPGNTDPTLTLGDDWRSDPERQWDTYFRVVSSDREQGLYGARYAYEELGVRRAVVIHHPKDVSKNLALIYDEAFRDLGGTVSGVFEAEDEDAVVEAVERAQDLDPELVFIGGEYPYGGMVVKAMDEIGMSPPDVVALGGDGLVDADFGKEAGREVAQGHYASLVGATAEFLPESKPFTDAYEERYDAEDWSAFGPPAFDATNIAIWALAEVIEERETLDEAARREVVATIQDIEYDGTLGTTSFDEFGDTTDRLLTMNRFEGDDWKALGADRL